MGHAERQHSILSASGAYRWMACPPSALLETQFPDHTSDSAQEGTLAHELAEARVRNYALIGDFNKRKLNAVIKKLKTDPLWDDEMLVHTDTYLDYIRSAALRFEHTPSVSVEKRVYFGRYTHAEMKAPQDDAEGYGTADCVLVGSGVIHIIDFKYGKSPDGRVDAVENPQMLLYALGTYEAYKLLYPVSTIRMSIVQPRLPEGISEWEISLEELLDRGETIRQRAELAWKGGGGYSPDGKTCRYCRARARCRARAEQNVRLAFSEDLGKLPPLISNEQLAEYLKMGTDLVKWYGDLKDAGLAECLAGHAVPGWKAVEGRGSRDWTDMDGAFEALKKAGISEEMLWERKPLTLAQVEKMVGKKPFSETVGNYIVKTPGKPALVEAADKRPAITNKITAAEAFEIREENEV